MVEGGGIVHTQFLADDLVDELQLVVAPFFVGDSSAPALRERRALPVERRGGARRSPRCARSATWCCCATRSRPGSGTHERATVRASRTGPATGLLAQVLLLAVLAATAGLGAAGWLAGVACAAIMAAALARGLARGPASGWGRRPG